MPVYDYFRAEKFGTYSHTHKGRKEFATRDEVEKFCRKHGFVYREVSEEELRRFRALSDTVIVQPQEIEPVVAKRTHWTEKKETEPTREGAIP